MQIRAAAPEGPALRVTWDDNSTTDFPLLWLRDNCASGFHPQTRERQFDLLTVAEDLSVRSLTCDATEIQIDWVAEEPHTSRFQAAWLAAHRPALRAPDPADVAAETWGAGFAPPRFEAAQLMGDGDSLMRFLVATKRSGISVVEGVAGAPEAGFALGERIGFLRRTNFGQSFRVESKPNPNNLAFTAEALPLHTDLPNQELPPGFQFLHCISNAAEGGGSVFADGFRIAERVRDLDPEAFRLLSRAPIPFRFHDGECDIRVHRPVIGLDERGQVFDIRYSPHLAAAFDMPADIMIAYYRAYRLFMAQARDPGAAISFRLCAGEIVVFDNRRVLHGRERFRPATGYRLLSGFYVDRSEYDSRIRQLAGAAASVQTGQ